jgi:hypothetical protein
VLAFKAGGGKIVFNAMGSASTVPTRKYKNNQEIAQLRLNQGLLKITNSIKQRGVAEADITVGSNKAVVAGPTYKGDAKTNAAEYEKYQFVKICLPKQ